MPLDKLADYAKGQPPQPPPAKKMPAPPIKRQRDALQKSI